MNTAWTAAPTPVPTPPLRSRPLAARLGHRWRARATGWLALGAGLLAFGLSVGHGGADSPPAQPPAAGPWQLVRRDAGIIVHRRTVAGSSLHEFRGRGTVRAPIKKVLAVLQDTGRRVEWVDRCTVARVIERPTERSEIAYSRIRGGFAISDRDMVTLARATFDVGRRQVRVDFEAISDRRVPVVRRVVRMPYLKGHWILKPQAGDPQGATDVEYQVHADPGGWLPTFAVNLVSKEIPHKTILALRRQVARVNYPELEQRIAALPEYQELFR